MKKIWVLGVLGLICLRAESVEKYYAGIQLGQSFLTETGNYYRDAFGVGVDLGIRATPKVEVMFRSQRSSHNASYFPLPFPLPATMAVWSNTLSANYVVWSQDIFEVLVGGGPGFYLFDLLVNDTRFGLHAEASADVTLAERFRLGLGFRWHQIFAPQPGEGSYWNMMLRLGVSFNAK